jgi:hypothetical protein
MAEDEGLLEMTDDTVLARCHELVWGARSVFARDLSRIRLAAHAPVGRVKVEHTPLGVSRARRELLRKRRNLVAPNHKPRQEIMHATDENED